MNGLLSSLPLLCALLLCAACTSVTTPVLRHETGETLGQGRLQLRGRLETGRVLPFVPAGASYANIAQSGSPFTGMLLGFQASYGLWEEWDLQLGSFFSSGSAGWRLGAKNQLMGPPQSSADSGDFSWAVMAGIGTNSSRGSADYSTATSQVSVSSALSSLNIDLSAPISLRLSKSTALYSGFGVTYINASGTTDGSAVSGNSFDFSLNLGVQTQRSPWVFSAELAIAYIRDPFVNTARFLPYFGLMGGVVF